MKKRVLIAVVLVLAMVMIAQTGAWAGKLFAGSEAPAPAPAEAAARPAGTAGIIVDRADRNWQPSGPNSKSAPYVPPATTPLAFNYEEYAGNDIPEGAPEGTTIWKGTESGSGAGDTLTKAYTVAVEGSSVSYWNGSEWVELTVSDGEVTIPAGAPNSVFLAVSN